jgi:hypothetical protein
MAFDELKLYGLNLAALLVGLTDIDTMLKILLSIIAISYTIHKWILMIQRKNKS